jgi:hypothetical protein
MYLVSGSPELKGLHQLTDLLIFDEQRLVHG